MRRLTRQLLVLGLLMCGCWIVPAAHGAARTLTAETARSQARGCRPAPARLLIGGRCRRRVTLRFHLATVPGPVSFAALRLQARGAAVTVWHGRRRLATIRGKRMLDVTELARGRWLTITLTGGRAAGSVARPALAVRWPAVTAARGVWVTPAELAARPTSGAAWERLRAAADKPLGAPSIADQDSDHDVGTLAAALAYARTGDAGYRRKTATAVGAAIGTERGGRTLALARNLASYVIAADLIDLRSYDPQAAERFAAWLAGVRNATLDGKTLVSTHENRANNWGTMAGASRIAVALYLGDGDDLDRAAGVFAEYVGESRARGSGLSFKDTSWQADPSHPLGINPPNAVRDGVDLDGAIPDDLRRGCSFAPVPCRTGYPWEALQGVVVQAELLARHGYPAYSWGQEAVARAASFLERLDRRFGGWWATGDDTWLPYVLNHAYGARWPLPDRARPGKILGWTDWVYGP